MKSGGRIQKVFPVHYLACQEVHRIILFVDKIIWAKFYRVEETQQNAQHEISSLTMEGYQPNFHSLLIACFWYIQLLFAYPENYLETWLVIMFLSRQKFPAKQIVVLSSSMKLGPEDKGDHGEKLTCGCESAMQGGRWCSGF